MSLSDDEMIFSSMVSIIDEISQRQVGVNDVNNLVYLRDKLSFEGDDWYREIDSEIVTFDSAFTFEPSDKREQEIKARVIKEACSKILQLIERKIR